MNDYDAVLFWVSISIMEDHLNVKLYIIIKVSNIIGTKRFMGNIRVYTNLSF